MEAAKSLVADAHLHLSERFYYCLCCSVFGDQDMWLCWRHEFQSFSAGRQSCPVVTQVATDGSPLHSVPAAADAARQCGSLGMPCVPPKMLGEGCQAERLRVRDLWRFFFRGEQSLKAGCCSARGLLGTMHTEFLIQERPACHCNLKILLPSREMSAGRNK